ncbi:MAG: GGDEF domain-containing protein [Phycisphaerae bacterium]|nr:GGDEF domain-containing protein [Phycisphaerae bacterium]
MSRWVQEPLKSILVVGDIRKVFSDFQVTEEDHVTICEDMVEALNIVGNREFNLIAVVMPEKSAKFFGALKTLANIASDVRLILLAQMWQEPLARKLCGSNLGEAAYADEYLICPIEWRKFIETLQYAKKPDMGTEDIHSSEVTPEKIAELEKLATTDELTGLKNRRYIWEFARQIIDHAKEQGFLVTLLLFDIDNFKHYNDVYSHSTGDEILKEAAKLMLNCCREHDVVGRVGGDEFAVIFWDGPKIEQNQPQQERRGEAKGHPSEPVFIANRFRKAINKASFSRLGTEGNGVLTISGGLATFPKDGQNMDELFEKADQALLEAKRSGKNRIYLVGSENSSEISKS